MKLALLIIGVIVLIVTAILFFVVADSWEHLFYILGLGFAGIACGFSSFLPFRT